MNEIQLIAVSKLRPSPRNVRKTGGNDVTDLKASIRAEGGLLQNLVVREGGTAGTYEVDAGGRRLRALQELVAEGHFADDYPVPCKVLAPGEDGEASAHENLVRVPMHPADAFDVFAKFNAEGRSPPEIAARFGVPERQVEQRLKLARCAPELIAAYRADELELAQLEAFAITDDHEAQLRHWKRGQREKWKLGPREIRSALTKGEIDFADDVRCKVVPLAEYQAAGGPVRQDLFDEGNYLQDAELLDRLATEKVQATAAAIQEAEGWAWSEGRVTFDPEDERKSGLGRIGGRWEDRKKFSKDERAIAGVVVCASRGGFEIHRGLLRSEDARAARKLAKDKGGGVKQPKAEKPELSQALRDRLQVQRTLALRAELITRPKVALAVLAQALLLDTFDPETFLIDSCLRGDRRPVELPGDDLPASPAFQAVEQARMRWVEQLPKEGALWPWVAELSTDKLLEIVAIGVALLLDARHSGRDFYGDDSDAGHVAQAVGLDMRKWWQASVDSYLGAVPKRKVIEALEEAGFKKGSILHSSTEMMKSKEAAAEAEKLLAGKGWLPALLRAPGQAAALASEPPKADSKSAVDESRKKAKAALDKLRPKGKGKAKAAKKAKATRKGKR